NDVAVRIPVPDPERRVAFETVFVSDDALREEIIDHLGREGVDFQKDLRVEVTLVETTELTEPSLVCRNIGKPAPAAQSVPAIAHVRLTPIDADSQDLTRTRIQVGRQTEVMDDRRRLVRRNDFT